MTEYNHPLDTITKKFLEEAQQSTASNTPQIEGNSSDIIDRSYQKILKPGALIKIENTKTMDKNLLLDNLFQKLRKEDIKTAKLDLELAENAIQTELKSFLTWVCINSADSLELPYKLDTYWKDDRLGYLQNCTQYFQKYLLVQINTPLVLAIDNFDLLKYFSIDNDFRKLLRRWHKYSQSNDNGNQIWKKLRLILLFNKKDIL